MTALALIYAFAAAAFIVIMGIGAISRTDFALGMVSMMLVILAWDLLESMYGKSTDR